MFVNPDLSQFLYKAAASAAVGVIMAVIFWPFRLVRKEWKTLKDDQSIIHEELVKQRENHLTHIEQYGKQQTELLTKVCEVLDGVRLDLREQTTILRIGCPRVAQLAKRKK